MDSERGDEDGEAEAGESELVDEASDVEKPSLNVWVTLVSLASDMTNSIPCELRKQVGWGCQSARQSYWRVTGRVNGG